MSNAFKLMISWGFFTEDPECMYCAPEESSIFWRYQIQTDSDNYRSAVLWMEPTTLKQFKYLKSIAKSYPRAVILKKMRHNPEKPTPKKGITCEDYV